MRIRISGMFCPHCERAVERELAAVPGVAAARASFSGGWAEITLLPECGDSLPRHLLEEAIRRAGYQPGPPDGDAAGMRATARGLCVLGLALMAFWLLERAVPSRWTGYFPDPGTASSLWALWAVGLLTSLHCLAMCGGIAMTQGLAGVRQTAPMRTSVLRGSALCYQAGRLLSYSAVGGLAGGLGSGLTLGPATRGAVMLAAGAFMLVMALNMLGGFAVLRHLQLRPPRWLAERIQGMARGKALQHGQGGWRGPLLIGLANGLMPCGPLQAMQLYALGTGSAWGGACAMAVFCLGTMPAMLGLSLLSGSLGRRGRGCLHQAAAVLVALLGLGMVHNGLALRGFSAASLSPAGTQEEKVEGARAHRTGNGQAVTSMADYDAYEPIVVQRGLPVTWTLVMPEEKLIGCNNEILAPELGIAQKLTPGANNITFTPTKTGVFAFSCWMGMIHSQITVVDAL
ncbi:MAG: sulfite exporter TauE/SafE family protein [Desulfovibrio sp.]|nr:sulfite exporter TauE/SafE family protein [Desulfovibrio sp.]